jgi:hypothetical protein
VLAQLDEREDVETAEVDRRGERLRIRTRGDVDPAGIRDDLERMGFAAEVATDADAATRWYGVASVGELSREEGAVIASRVVPAFGAANGLGRELIDDLSTLVARALYECFVGHQDVLLVPSVLASSCGRAVTAATSMLIGLDRATALAQAIESDMSNGSGR